MKFSKRVYSLVKKIPRGKISTYKEIAKALDTRAYRAVGNALNKNRDLIKIPCHRVVNSNGKIGGYVKSISKKRNLLKSEGVKIVYERIDLGIYLWSFNKNK